MRNEIIDAIKKEKIIAIIRGVEKEYLISLAEALLKGGIKLLEITYSANGAVSDEKTAENIKMLAENFKGRMFIGAGTVLTPEQVELTKKAGGQFIISPDTYDAVIKKTRELDMVSIPGAFSPTDIQNAHRAGADFVKLFPITNLGISYLKAVKAPLSHINLLAVGGVNEKNVGEFIKAGAAGVGVGGGLTNKEWIQNGEFDKITALAEEFVKNAR